MKRLLLRYSFRAYYDLGAVRTAVMSHQGFSPRRSNQRTFEKVAASSFVQRRTTRISSKEISPLACLQMEGRMMAERSIPARNGSLWRAKGLEDRRPLVFPATTTPEQGFFQRRDSLVFSSFSRSRHASKLLLGMLAVRTVCPFIPIQTRACQTQAPELANGITFLKVGGLTPSMNVAFTGYESKKPFWACFFCGCETLIQVINSPLLSF